MKRESMQKTDEARKEDLERKALKRESDKREERKERDSQPERKAMKRESALKIQISKTIALYHEDTGFEQKCTCCEEYKGLDTCVPIEKLSEEDQESYLYLTELSRSKDGKFYVCKPCMMKIRRKKMLKKSERPRFMVDQIPLSFQERLMRACQRKEYILNDVRRFGESPISRRHIYPNKLESFILKIIIPYIRVGHTPKSRYLMVRFSVDSPGVSSGMAVSVCVFS